ncbi:uncharacterized protein BXZ73DRAFT_43141 [Epithele typhae]|uniref:uncharacterized protein n=1 Tax=Epithele typhae TaxID=378194 RepID=UPI0020072672|nr:uncharacterized protein BXZ73DRAFT_43141 [Epithele typhae]KAH9940109.1 hypothetical protein BXZ73DRAFT_43141 [Epithele typhae]
MTPFQPYSGSKRKLVLGIDIGTTFSGVAYALLDPGQIPQIHSVARFPGQENAAGDLKIPSMLYYNPDGTVARAGAEAMLPGMDLEAEDKGLFLVTWFKLHLRPQRLELRELKKSDLPPLPPGKTVVAVFADFLAYIFFCARKYISETHANGEIMWASLENDIEIVLSHPNGWEGAQQSKMRQAAYMASLIPNTPEGHSRVHFITEGEASLNFCVKNGLTDEIMRDGESVAIIDAGGGTIDISSYSFVSVSPFVVEEATTADCILQGSTRVNLRAESHIRGLLKNSKFDTNEDIKFILDYFDKNTKPVFKGEGEPYYIKFGSMDCNDAKLKIRRGQLMLTGNEMLLFFQPSINAILKAVKKQHRGAAKKFKTVLLVGGFAASPCLYSALKSGLERLGLSLCRPDSHTNKAVSHGAVSFFLQSLVAARVMKATVGTRVSVSFVPEDAEHAARIANTWRHPSGCIMVRKGFSPPRYTQGQSMREAEEVFQSYQQSSFDASTLDSITCKVLCYQGMKAKPRWTDTEPKLFVHLCSVHADTSKVTQRPMQGPKGTYYEQEYDVILLCGLTELQAQIRWMENVSIYSLLNSASALTRIIGLSPCLQGVERRWVTRVRPCFAD